MLNSLIHATVMASILAGLPAVEVRFVAFDTSIVDMSDKLAESVDLLLSVQLGGVSDIAPAMAFCESLVVNPSRTVIALSAILKKAPRSSVCCAESDAWRRPAPG
jgi:hypothetical protein